MPVSCFAAQKVAVIGCFAYGSFLARLVWWGWNKLWLTGWCFCLLLQLCRAIMTPYGPEQLCRQASGCPPPENLSLGKDRVFPWEGNCLVRLWSLQQVFCMVSFTQASVQLVSSRNLWGWRRRKSDGASPCPQHQQPISLCSPGLATEAVLVHLFFGRWLCLLPSWL